MSGSPLDASLVGDDGIVATSHRGLTYPLGKFGPGEGELHPLVHGIGWARIPIPGGLVHINVWAVEDGDGVALIDTGMNLIQCRESWDALFAGPLAGVRATRVIATHFHPDHVGLAGWLCERFGVTLWMTRTEWLLARLLCADQREVPPPAAVAYWRLAGWSEKQVADASARGWSRFGKFVSKLPDSFVRLTDGQDLTIGDRNWRVIIGSGHTPEHACLWQPETRVLIAGDQVLPRITSNVSVSYFEPDGDPLGDWLASIDRLLTLPDDLLVLPAHGEPFTGLHRRLHALRDGHLDRLEELAAHIGDRRRTVDCFPILFRRELSDDDLILATGEALAHLRRLEVTGRARREVEDGVAWFHAA